MAARDALGSMFEDEFRKHKERLGFDIEGVGTQRMSAVSHSGKIRIPVLNSHVIIENWNGSVSRELRMRVPHESGAVTHVALFGEDKPEVALRTNVGTTQYPHSLISEDDYKGPEHLSEMLQDHYRFYAKTMNDRGLHPDSKWHPNDFKEPHYKPIIVTGSKTTGYGGEKEHQSSWGTIDEYGRFVSDNGES